MARGGNSPSVSICSGRHELNQMVSVLGLFFFFLVLFNILGGIKTLQFSEMPAAVFAFQGWQQNSSLGEDCSPVWEML